MKKTDWQKLLKRLTALSATLVVEHRSKLSQFTTVKFIPATCCLHGTRQTTFPYWLQKNYIIKKYSKFNVKISHNQ